MNIMPMYRTDSTDLYDYFTDLLCSTVFCYSSVTSAFWPHDVVKHGICCQNVCPSVCLSVTLVSHA